MGVSYETVVIPSGNHASLAVPDDILTVLGTNRRAPLVVTVNGHTYRSTATAVDGECRVVFPSSDRAAAGVTGGDVVTVHLELETGRRAVEIDSDFRDSLVTAGMLDLFESLSYSRRKEFARGVAEAKTPETRARRILRAIESLTSLGVTPAAQTKEN